MIKIVIRMNSYMQGLEYVYLWTPNKSRGMTYGRSVLLTSATFHSSLKSTLRTFVIMKRRDIGIMYGIVDQPNTKITLEFLLDEDNLMIEQ